MACAFDKLYKAVQKHKMEEFDAMWNNPEKYPRNGFELGVGLFRATDTEFITKFIEKYNLSDWLVSHILYKMYEHHTHIKDYKYVGRGVLKVRKPIPAAGKHFNWDLIRFAYTHPLYRSFTGHYEMLQKCGASAEILAEYQQLHPRV